ncbi:MAG: class I poly(R)-hydroxyalkanoic acid synthase [Burkholderiales bacterium]|nr:class I poly(R)-hydroxyalkanoic acid synthase [Burkholderiales bacterium]
MAGASRQKEPTGSRQRSKAASKPSSGREHVAAKTAHATGGARSGSRTRAAGKAAAASAGHAGAAPRGRARAAQEAGAIPPQREQAARAAPSVHLPAERLGQIQGEYLQRLAALMSGEPPVPGDRRFAGEAWRQGPFAWAAGLYTLNAEFMQRMAEAVEGDALSRERIRFATQQWVDAMSPANFLLTNPEAQQRLIETRGESLRQGMQNLLADLHKGRISHTDEAAFEVGRNVATTPGSVVCQNELFQLIQYAPSTPQVGARPLLMVPPCINKFYILDLQPENSLVAYAVAQGHTVFMVSWKNIKADQDTVTWDDYLERGVIEAIRVVREISGQARINTLGFCVGGTLLANAAAVLAGRGERNIESMTLLTTFLDFSDPGVLGVFIDEAFVSYRESTIGKKGIMPGRELAATFNFLRPNDLVWNYVVSNYLKGEAPPAFDLLYWNADSTNLPGPMYCWYLRHMYLQNELREPGRLVCAGVPVDLREIDVPTFVYGSREDHIVPWRGAYESTQLLAGPLRFVLGASGHIAGVINPASKGKRSHWVGETLPEEADDWFAAATELPGSWWPEWSRWLAGFAGESRPAPKQPGNARYRAIEPAPGSYVKEKAE